MKGGSLHCEGGQGCPITPPCRDQHFGLANEGLLHCFINNKAAAVPGAAEAEALGAVAAAAMAAAAVAAAVGIHGPAAAIVAEIPRPTSKNFCAGLRTGCAG